MSIGEHLEELRKRVFFSLIYWVAASAVAGWYADGLMGILLRPFMEALERTGQPTEFVYLQPTDSFTVMFRIVLILGAFLASPFVFWEIWGFVGAGLYGKEKRVVLLAAPISFLLFVAGAVFFYLWVLPPAVDYLYSTGRGFFPDRPDWVIVQKPNIPDAVSFFLWMALTMGIVFQLPLRSDKIVFYPNNKKRDKSIPKRRPPGGLGRVLRICLAREAFVAARRPITFALLRWGGKFIAQRAQQDDASNDLPVIFH